MKELIDTLKKEHRVILEHLAAIKHQGAHTMEGRTQLVEARNQLLAHLDREDRDLYPKLEEIAQRDPQLKEMLDQFEEEMKAITVYCNRFFTKYSSDGGGIEFFREFDIFYNSLQDRIRKEEEILFVKCNKE